MPNVYELEKHLIPDLKEVPKCVEDALGQPWEEAIKEGYPIGIGYTKETGWYILMSGQGPFIFWIEKEQKVIHANDGRRIE